MDAFKIGMTLGRVYVMVDCNYMDQVVIGVYSTIDSGLESCYNYLESKYPNTTWIWDADSKTLENGEDELHIIYLLDYRVDHDRYGKTVSH